MEDWFAAEAPIVARLREQVPGLALVEGVRDVGEVTDSMLQRSLPAAVVMYYGDAEIEPVEDSAGEVVTQHWLVMLYTASARTPTTGADARAEAGALIPAIRAALAGWRPGPDFAPLRRRTFRLPPKYSARRFEFPLLFTTTFYEAGA